MDKIEIPTRRNTHLEKSIFKITLKMMLQKDWHNPQFHKFRNDNLLSLETRVKEDNI